MSYCRFENTYRDLRDCFENWSDEDLSKDEKTYKEMMLDLCIDIVEQYGDR
jgi:hypothetical protein